MFIEIDNFFCIDTTNIKYFKQFQDKERGQLCIIYTKEFPDGLKFEDKQGELYNNLKKIFNVSNVVCCNITINDEKVKW